MRTRLAAAAAVAGTALALAACGGGDPSTVDVASPADTATDETNADGSGPDPVAELLDFQASAVDGSTVDVSAMAGDDLVIWFWAPW